MKTRKTTGRLAIFLLLQMLSCSCALAVTTAAKNKEGNRLFLQGKYQEAEKAYLDAQLDAPGRPELLYNLGNALIRQKKYEPAVQSLRQAAGKADQGLRSSSWYNLGDAYFDAGDLQNAAQAFIQALRINPSDRDAKHNLELTLRRMQEQKQSASGKNSQDNRQEKKQGQQNSQSANNGQQDRKDRKEQGATRQQDKNQQPQQQQASADRRDDRLSKDKAMQMLDAMRDQELAEQRKLQEQQVRRKATGRDW